MMLTDLLSYLCYIAQTYLPRDSAAHSRLGPPTLIINQDNISQDKATGSMWSGQSFNCGSLSLGDPNWYQFDDDDDKS